MSKTKEDLIAELKSRAIENMKHHDVAVLMGTLGVSPKSANTYFELVKEISN